MDYSNILTDSYNTDNWRYLLNNVFGANFKASAFPDSLSIDNKTAKRAFQLGEIRLQDGEALAVYEVELHDNIYIAQNRVAIRNLLRTHWNKYDGAFIANFKQDDADWRFSFVSETRQWGENGDYEMVTTATKRYTYLLGKNQGCRTAVERFQKLKNETKTLAKVTEAFSVESLTKQFYNELFSWYQWALSEEVGVTFPNDTSIESDDRKIDEHIIRLITRLMFVWFIKQRNLIPNQIFQKEALKNILKEFDPLSKVDGNFYNGIIQNLFFATLNKVIDERDFAKDGSHLERKEHYGIKTLFRNPKGDSWFKISNEDVLKLFSKVPFLNGGLFECLDKELPDSKNKVFYYDGFSRESGKQNRAFLPNCLFFDPQRGIIPLLEKYNFTIEENSPTEVEVALDPELLGKVFENLLGAYNPETKETARKQSGSFYTPREIVNYMVDESLIHHLANVCKNIPMDIIRQLFTNDILPNQLQENENYRTLLTQKIKEAKILDPACGSGAYPMGILNRMVDILKKLHDESESLYNLKLHLIENCIYGIDIQTIAVQISKLRFFISLICEQAPTNDSSNNYGITPLPNLETKFVSANTLLGLKKRDAQLALFEDPQIEITKKELIEVRHKHFSAQNVTEKSKYRKQDEILRNRLAKLLETNKMFAPEDAQQLALWNPYNQNSSSSFFDTEWMFGFPSGFDIVIGNPPYVQLQNNKGELAKQVEKCGFETFSRKGDIYCIFYEKGIQLLKQKGILCYITSNKWMRAEYGEATRNFFAKNTNPIQLIDFGGIKIFESATVDTNILLLSNDKNEGKTEACTVKEKCTNKLSDYIVQNNNVLSFKNHNSWIILTPIEQGIKEKIEKIGTPLKDWDINIYRGVLTGYNEAFIINGNKKDELIAQDPKSAEIIRPILRGRDIKQYSYEFANLYLITTFPSKHYDIDNYPAIKQHLLSFGYDRLKQTGENGSRKKTNNKWFEIQDSIGYWEDFYRQKIIYPNMTKFMPFLYDDEHFMTNQKCFIITGEHIAFLTAFFNSSLFKYCFRDNFPELQGGTRELSKIFFDLIPVIQIDSITNKLFFDKIVEIQRLKKLKKETIDIEITIDNMIFDLYNLNNIEREIIGFIEIQ